MSVDPGDLYRVEVAADDLKAQTLLLGVPGFLDAGGGVRLSTAQILASLDHEVVVTFDHDVLIDYRARRPRLTFAEDHYEDYQPPAILLHRVTDPAGTDFLLLEGPEPDFLWDRFVGAVLDLITRFEVTRTVGMLSIPMAVPHTRPVTATTHANRPGLIETGANVWSGRIGVPASIGALLELRLAERAEAAFGFAVHVPYYLAESEYPAAAAALLDSAAGASGLVLPLGELNEGAERVKKLADQQLRGNAEIARVVETLETQYDQLPSAGNTARSEFSTMSAEEIGAQVEDFLARRDDTPGGPPPG